jgi:3-hydroxyisobutyrate dehydrogenase-like beta-hydroxyacid dehydrogenase
VKLAEHLGHTVTVTGVPHHETKAEKAKEAKTEPAETKEAEAKEAGDLLVTSLKKPAHSKGFLKADRASRSRLFLRQTLLGCSPAGRLSGRERREVARRS